MNGTSFIHIEFESLGSTNYALEAQGITSAQLFAIAGILKWEAEQAYGQEKMEEARQRFAVPPEGILKP